MGESRRETRSRQKREEILDAAAEAFRIDGFEATSMDRIAEQAGASKRTLYNHFGSKEALFVAMVNARMRALRALSEVTFDPDEPVAAQLVEVARAKGAAAADPEWAGLLRVVLGVMARYPDLAAQAAAESEKGEDSLVRFMREATAAGALRAEDPERATAHFWALIKGAVFWPRLFSVHPAPPPEAEQAELEDLVATFLARYGASP